MFNKTRSVWILTATAFLAIMVVFAPAIQAAGRGNKWIALRYKFEPGERLEYVLTITTSATNIISGPGSQQEIPVATKTKMNLRYDVLDVDSEGAATVKMTLDEINSDVQSMGQSINVRIGASGTKMHSGGMLLFDSNQMAGGEDVPIREMLGLATMPDGVHFDDLFRKGITARISRFGEMSLPDIEQG
ncbi:MAG: hypothetical protein KAJ01_01385, partial [Candidatus Hydrogenedentes bacterium]|nr:hypothetical protein [Candidatus Hydrogenedentota bacterium]